MKTKVTIEPFNGFMIRTPLFPYSQLKQNMDNNHFGNELIKSLLKDKVFMEAIYLSSPPLFNECLKIDSNNLDDTKYVKIRRSLLRYYVRMSSRSTPFGLFAGIGFGTWGNENTILIKSFEYCIHPDMTAKNNMCRYYYEKAKKWEDMRFYTNATLFKVGDQYRYIVRTDNGSPYKIMMLHSKVYIDEIIEKVTHGAGFDELLPVFEKRKLNIKDLKCFLSIALKNQLLFPQYHTCEKTPQNCLASKVLDADGHSAERDAVSDKTMRFAPGDNIDILKSFAKCFQRFSDRRSSVIYSNVYSNSTSSTLNKDLINTLSEAVDVLLRLEINKSESNFLNEFIEKFLQKYNQKEVRLLEAMDPETGIQLDSEVLYNYEFPVKITDYYKTMSHENIENEKGYSLLLKLIDRSIINRSREVVVSNDDLAEIADYDRLPCTFNAFFSILENNPNPSILLKSISGPSATCLLGRFTKISGEVDELVKEISRFESVKYNQQLCEIDFMPEGMASNVTNKNIHHPLKISVLERSGNSEVSEILLSDLFIRIKEERIILRSGKTGEEVIPCNSSAHNFSNSHMGVYRFLSELQKYYMGPSYYFNWNGLEKYFTFLPRIKYKNIVLYPASWNFSGKQLRYFINYRNKAMRMDAFVKWKRKYNIPDKILLSDFDNELLIDTNNEVSVDLFISMINKRESVCVKEFLSDNSNVVRSPDGSHLHEMVVPLKKVS